ncbi:hypothetical protein AXK60_17480 [Tsukamurella pseudospumae]|uniref:DUF4436 domain-containing protein n=1 Tax=Tsukamurella pseudospumae TaxID=239498 RepID=A0A137ZZK4_9ACTN|nr:hypothetical protein AXK60_17480 [Tsukamurella pseudospumae]
MALLLLGVFTSALFLVDRTYGYAGLAAGPDESELNGVDAVRVTVVLKRIDTSSSTAIADILVEPIGTLTDGKGRFLRPASVELSTYRTDPIAASAGRMPSVEERRIAVTGTAVDYPFDRYRMSFSVTPLSADGRPIPATVIVVDSVGSFAVKPVAQTNDGGALDVDLTAARTAPSIAFAGFVMLLMFGLAGAALTAAYYVLAIHRGLLFPACSMLAGMLFALPPLRHQLPGDPAPPTGSFIDFVAFFPALAIVALSLISAVLGGYAIERRAARTESG